MRVFVRNTNEIYSRGSKEGPSKVTKTVKIMKFTKIAKFSPLTQNKVKLPFKLFTYFLVGYARSFKHKLLPIHDIR